jgi:hypothetical protein
MRLQQCRGFRERSVAAEELRAIGRASLLPARHVHECDTRLKVRAPGIAREQRPGFRLDFSHDERRRLAARVAQDPVQVVSDRELPNAGGAIDDLETRT